jgi:hypothetical protein
MIQKIISQNVCFLMVNQYKPPTAEAQGLEAATGVPMVIFSPSAPSTSMTSTPPSSGASGALVTKSFYICKSRGEL